MFRKTMVLSLVASSALLLGVAAPAMAETSPAVGMPPLTEWVFNGDNTNPGVDFDYSGNVVVFPIATNVSSVDAHWGGIDNPAPLLWYAKHVGPAWLGQSMMPQGVKYSAALIATMNAESFAPSMVGGYNPPGITVGSSHTSLSSSPVTVASSSGTHLASSTSPTAHQAAASISAKATHSATTRTAAPVATSTGHTVTPAQPVSTMPVSQAAPVLAHRSASVTALSPSASPLVVPPGHQSQTAYAAEGQHLQADHRLLHPAPKHWGHWVWAGAALVAVLAALYAIPRILNRSRGAY